MRDEAMPGWVQPTKESLLLAPAEALHKEFLKDREEHSYAFCDREFGNGICGEGAVEKGFYFGGRKLSGGEVLSRNATVQFMNQAVFKSGAIVVGPSFDFDV